MFQNNLIRKRKDMYMFIYKQKWSQISKMPSDKTTYNLLRTSRLTAVYLENNRANYWIDVVNQF